MLRIKFSKHCIRDRADRITQIATTIGFGDIVDYFPQEDGCRAVTSTGVILVMTKARTEIITMWVATVAQMMGMYHGKVPKKLFEQAQRYEKKKMFPGK